MNQDACPGARNNVRSDYMRIIVGNCEEDGAKEGAMKGQAEERARCQSCDVVLFFATHLISPFINVPAENV